jgi:hypothetical protein
LGRLWTRDGQHAGVQLPDQVATALPRLGAQTPGHDDFAVFSQGFSDGVQAFFDRVINEPAGIDDHQISTLKGFDGLVTLGVQLGQDQLRIGQRLGAPQTGKTDLGSTSAIRFGVIHAMTVWKNLGIAFDTKCPKHLIGLLLHLLLYLCQQTF